MKNKCYFILILVVCITACKSKSTYRGSKTTTTISNVSSSKKAQKIVNHAKSFLGTRYKYAGSTEKGMDCSGLVYRTFSDFNINLSRSTKALLKEGKWVDVKALKKGDLVFFATKKNSRKVNHVGIVTKVINKDYFQFIHASSSKGVITSSIRERYWYNAYVQGRRILKYY